MSADRPVFVSVATSAYSGATLLAFLLGAHPQIGTIGEMNGLIASEDPDKYLCSCGNRIKACGFWQSVKAAMRERGFEFDVAHFDTRFIPSGPPLIQRLRMGSFRSSTLDSIRDRIFQISPGEARRLETWVARNVAFVEAVLEVMEKEVFVDTSKDRWRLKSLQEFSSLDVRAIHLVRDVRGVACSQLRRKASLDAREAARRWAKLNQKLEITLQSLPKERQFLLRYEDLCQDAHGTLEHLFRFCGVDSGVRVTDFREAAHHIVGNVMRLENPSEVRLDQRWKSYLTERQLEEIDRVAGTLRHRYGYC
jgi:hypothetical protein